MRSLDGTRAGVWVLLATISCIAAACGKDFSAATAESPGGAVGEAGMATEPNNGGTNTANGGTITTGGSATPTGGSGGSGAVTSGNAGAPDVGEAGAPSVDVSKYRAAVLADKPLVYWRMSSIKAGAIVDDTGGGNDLVLQGQGYALRAAGALASETDGALELDGAAAYAIAKDSRALDFTGNAAFTLECWALRQSGGESYFQHLLSHVEGVAGDRTGYALYVLPKPAAMDNARSVFEYDRPMQDLGVWGPLPEQSSWAHYAAVFDGKLAALYVNGTLANTSEATSSIGERNSPFTVGRASGSGSYFKGALDEIAVYPRALDAAALARHIALAK